MNWRDTSNVETLEPRTLFSAQTFLAGKTLEVNGDPLLQNDIQVEYGDAAKTRITVSIMVILDPAVGPTYNQEDAFGVFLARQVNKIVVNGGAASDSIGVGDTNINTSTIIPFNINTVVNTGGGNNDVYIGAANTTVNGGAGNDSIIAGDGNDIIRGGAGNDYIAVGNGTDKISGGDGDDTIMGGHGRETISGGAGNDHISVQDLAHGGDLIYGGPGDDQIVCGNGNDTIWGGPGNDIMQAGSGNVVFGIGIGNDQAYNSDGKATFYTPDLSNERTDYDPAIDKVIRAVSKNETIDPVIR